MENTTETKSEFVTLVPNYAVLHKQFMNEFELGIERLVSAENGQDRTSEESRRADLTLNAVHTLLAPLTVAITAIDSTEAFEAFREKVVELSALVSAESFKRESARDEQNVDLDLTKAQQDRYDRY